MNVFCGICRHDGEDVPAVYFFVRFEGDGSLVARCAWHGAPTFHNRDYRPVGREKAESLLVQEVLES